MLSIREAGFESCSCKGPPARTGDGTNRGWDERGWDEQRMGQKERTCGGDRRSFFCVGGRDFCKSLYEYEKLMVIRYRIVVNIVCRNYRKKIKRMKEILTERETPERGRGELRNLYKIENYAFASVVCLCYIDTRKNIRRRRKQINEFYGH